IIAARTSLLLQLLQLKKLSYGQRSLPLRKVLPVVRDIDEIPSLNFLKVIKLFLIIKKNITICKPETNYMLSSGRLELKMLINLSLMSFGKVLSTISSKRV